MGYCICKRIISCMTDHQITDISSQPEGECILVWYSFKIKCLTHRSSIDCSASGFL